MTQIEKLKNEIKTRQEQLDECKKALMQRLYDEAMRITEDRPGPDDDEAPVRRARRRRVVSTVTEWVADRNARRVPKFVLEQTGLKTKQEIVAKYGEDARFEVDGALPNGAGA